jgi:hypothetical protein
MGKTKQKAKQMVSQVREMGQETPIKEEVEEVTPTQEIPQQENPQENQPEVQQENQPTMETKVETQPEAVIQKKEKKTKKALEEMSPKELRRQEIADTLGLSDDSSVYKFRDYLTSQENPLGAYMILRKSLDISDKLDRAIKIEMHRIGFGEF